MAEVKRLASACDVLLLQEVHGCTGDEIVLQQELPGCIVRASFGASAGVGGVAVIIGLGVAAGLNAVFEDVVEPGRVLAVTLAGAIGQVTVASVHVDPHSTSAQKRRLLASLRSAVPRDAPGAVVVGGDFNWTSPGDARTEWPTMAQRKHFTSSGGPHLGHHVLRPC